jgi:Raf kinase inhibitor-like YbhB/YbcL family protein
MTFAIRSPDFLHNGHIPPAHTCEGEDIAPALEWSGAPQGTRSFALIVDDPDAPDPKAPKMTYVHWVLYDIPDSASGIQRGGETPSGARDGKNDWKRTGYGGPCPPIGRHRYYFKLYALDTMLGDLKSPDKPGLLKAMEGHILGKAEVMGTYQKANT